MKLWQPCLNSFKSNTSRRHHTTHRLIVCLKGSIRLCYAEEVVPRSKRLGCLDPLRLLCLPWCPSCRHWLQPFLGCHVRGPLSIIREQWTGKNSTPQSIVSFVLRLQERLMETAEARPNLRARPGMTRKPEIVHLMLEPRCWHWCQTTLTARWQGPYTVLEKVSPVSYRIETPERRKVRQFHINMLREWTTPASILAVMLMSQTMTRENSDGLLLTQTSSKKLWWSGTATSPEARAWDVAGWTEGNPGWQTRQNHSGRAQDSNRWCATNTPAPLITVCQQHGMARWSQKRSSIHVGLRCHWVTVRKKNGALYRLSQTQRSDSGGRYQALSLRLTVMLKQFESMAAMKCPVHIQELWQQCSRVEFKGSTHTYTRVDQKGFSSMNQGQLEMTVYMYSERGWSQQQT